MSDDLLSQREDRATRIEGKFLWPTTIAALGVLPVVVLSLLSSSPTAKTLTIAADWVIWGVFLSEVVVLLVVVPDRAAWLRHHRLFVFILVAACPVLPLLFDNSDLTALSPALLLVQKLIKLAKLDRIVRKRGLHVPFGRWILVTPGVLSVLLLWAKVNMLAAVVLAAALILGLIGPGGHPDPTALRRLLRSDKTSASEPGTRRL